MKTNLANPSTEAIARLGQVIEKKGNREAAFYVIRGACKRATGGALSLDDLPDLPCVMNAGDEIEFLFASEGATAASLAQAREFAQEAVAELLAEEGIEMGDYE